MKLSTRGKYGLQAMVDLGVYGRERHIPLKQIAKRLRLSENYLEQLIAMLRKAGLVKSVRGSQGGYSLAHSPGKITVGQVLRALEGSLAPTSCSCEDEHYHCEDECRCVTKGVWVKIRDGINEVVDSITIQDLLDDYESINGERPYMFYI